MLFYVLVPLLRLRVAAMAKQVRGVRGAIYSVLIPAFHDILFIPQFYIYRNGFFQYQQHVIVSR